jgi:hypothetical protein
MTQKLIQGDQINGSSVTAGDADLLNGDNAAFYRDAGNLNAGSLLNARVTASNITQHQASINHDALLNFVANEHINHTSVSISGGTSLSGGGAINANRTITLLNDSASPGNSKLYGTNGAGTKGWYSQPASSAFTSSGAFAYSSANQLVSWTHSLGHTPTAVMVEMRCTSADRGFAVNDRVFVSSFGSHYSDSGGNCCGNAVGVFPWRRWRCINRQMELLFPRSITFRNL